MTVIIFHVYWRPYPFLIKQFDSSMLQLAFKYEKYPLAC